MVHKRAQHDNEEQYESVPFNNRPNHIFRPVLDTDCYKE